MQQNSCYRGYASLDFPSCSVRNAPDFFLFPVTSNARSSIMNKTAEQQKDRIVCRVNEVAAQA
ncbi:hypothetical protein [Diaphorobacter caeni]|uniref:hypothetical protein n=1 Tax=Diaphorobacter caeni TaxID=2784387 RepID=UPI00188E0135|nr:hypothetical protein [Diaphorobacter caeni]MBF5004791.1 hypothetical protein [Diaphorobacter caeni]